ncbi:MAG TPA: hypothetical protein VF615_14275 [Longimicrobiaceae bacterium]|jgi:hypothetical protein
MSANAAVRFPEPDDFRPRELPRLVSDDGEEAPPPAQEAPSLAPPGVVPPGAVASAELPWEQPRVRGIRPPPLTSPYWRTLHAAAGALCVLFLLVIAVTWLGLFALAR